MDHSTSPSVARAFGSSRARPRVVGIYHPQHGWVVQAGREVLSIASAVSLKASGVTYVNLKWKGRCLKLSLLKMELPGAPAADPAHRSAEQLRVSSSQSHWYETKPVSAGSAAPIVAVTPAIDRQRYRVTVTVEVEGAGVGVDDEQLLQAGVDALQSSEVRQRLSEISLAS